MKFNLPDIAYTPRGWMYGDVEPSDMKKEYQRLRKVANERLRKLKKAGYADSEIYRRFRTAFPEYSKVKTNRKANFLGVHSEGPYLSVKYKALMDERYLRDFSLEELNEMLQSASGVL